MTTSSTRFFFSMCAVFVCAFALKPCHGQPVNVGVLLPLTGKLSVSGQMGRNSFLMARDEINASGGIHGRELRMLMEDTGGSPELSSSAAAHLIEEENVAVLTGGFSSSATLAALQVSNAAQVPFLVTTASADKITEQGWEYVYRLSSPFSETLDALESFLARTTRARRVGIIYRGNRSGKSSAQVMFGLFRRWGLRVVLREGYEPETMAFHALVERLVSVKPDIVYMASSAGEAAAFLSQARIAGLTPMLFAGDETGVISSEFGHLTTAMAHYTCSVTMWSPSVPYSGAREYYSKYAARYGEDPDYHGAQAYAAAYVIARALKRADALEPEGLCAALDSTDEMTVFGPVKFQEYGRKARQNRISSIVMQWISADRLEPVWPRHVATHGAVSPFPGWFYKP